MRRWIASGWVHAGLALWLIAFGGLGVMSRAVNAPGPTVQDRWDSADVTIVSEQQAVWWTTSCTPLRWDIEGISGVWLDGEPTTGERQESYCLPPPETYRGFYRDPARPHWRVQVASGEVRQYSIPVYVMTPFIVRWLAPLVIIGLGLMTVPLVPARLRTALLRARPLTLTFDWRRLTSLIGFGVALGGLLVFVYRVTLAPPLVATFPQGDASVNIALDLAAFTASGGCATLTWDSENVASLELNREPSDLTGTAPLCAPRGASFVTIYAQATTNDDIDFGRTVVVPVASASMWYTLLPGLLIGIWFAGPWTRGNPHTGVQALAVGVIVLAAYNITRHSPWVAYDGVDHFRYVLALSEGRFPTEDESNQFFAPPLAYVVPAVAHRTAIFAGLPPCPDYNSNTAACLITAKAGQLQNILLAIGTVIYSLRIAQHLAPNRVSVAAWMLAIIGTNAAFYRALTFNRGEPFTIFLTTFLVYQLLLMLRDGPSRRAMIIYGLGTGLLIISRQWGVFAAMGMALWALVVVIQHRDGPLFRAGLGAYALALLSGGWFYLLNIIRFGSLTAFNRPDEAGKPLEFFIGLGNGSIFTEPFRTIRVTHLVPTYYSELWGDFGGFWFVPVLDFDIWASGAPPSLLAYLGRVNLAALAPTAVGLIGLLVAVAWTYDWLRRGGEDR
ncbi:MAG: hypothetical protein AAF125_08380, partial [Chloroflexota bacterium]